MPCGEDRTRDYAFVELGWRVNAWDRDRGRNKSGRLDRVEMRLNMNDRVVFVSVIVNAALPDLIWQGGIGQRGKRDHHAHEKQHEGQANPHLRPLATRFV
jgi:hypothetical protein